MFAEPGPRVFGADPGADFPAWVVRGLRMRLDGAPPEAMARVRLYVNTARMRRRITECFVAAGPGFLPRIALVTEIAGPTEDPPQVRRVLELGGLVGRLLDRAPDLAPRHARHDLAESLAALIAEMQGEGVAPEALSALDMADHAEHWRRTQAFLAIVAPFFAGDAADAPLRQRRAVEALAAEWAVAPPADPVIVAGSTGSRGTTARFMQAVAALPQGALLLPGFDFDLPAAGWAALDTAPTAEEHPQFRFFRLLRRLGVDPGAVRRWVPGDAPDTARNRLVSLALRPAPVTDRWIAEGPLLGDAVAATARLSLVEAASPRAEAGAIALILRKAAEDGRRAALVTPDRTLARLVTAALDRWGIVPDDSAGRPLAQTAPGRLLRQVAQAIGTRPETAAILALLKHPLAHSGADRGEHLRHARDLELALRRDRVLFPTPAALRDRAAANPDAALWLGWLSDWLDALAPDGVTPLAACVARHRALAEALARGTAEGGSGALWDREAGEAARAALDDLAAAADAGEDTNPFDYNRLVETLLAGRPVRETVAAHPGVMIWGTVEAREQGAELVVLGGLNDGSWPEQPAADPWLNRSLRAAAGLLLPDREIGLAAHDFQQAAGAPEAVLTRSLRDAEADRVPSRWLNRLTNLLAGLPDRAGPEALEAMRARGACWLALAEALDRPAARVPAATRPAPRPPVGQRPARLSVTEIRTLIRDPYAIYARHVLRLRPLDPLRPEPDARMRGTVLHRIVETYTRRRLADPAAGGAALLEAIAAGVLDERVPWAVVRTLWLARVRRMAAWFPAYEAALPGLVVLTEADGRFAVGPDGFVLTGRPDRIDRRPDGTLGIIDWKTGEPPSAPQQQRLEKQLLLLAIMAEAGAFGPAAAGRVGAATYVRLADTREVVTADVSPESLAATLSGLVALVARYADPAQGYIARRAMMKADDAGDYDHLARFGEWDVTEASLAQVVGREGGDA